MHIEQTKIVSIKEVQSHTFLLSIQSEYFAGTTNPGQFFNIKVSDNNFPLLRRPFSVCDVDGDIISFLFDVHGEGTKILSKKKPGDDLDVFGPLGNGFNYSSDFQTAIIVAGGLGVAPFPFLLKKIPADKPVFSFVGARNSNQLITYGIKNTKLATDDGSAGFRGNVVQLLKNEIHNINGVKKIFACGPNVMLRSLVEWTTSIGIETEISVECAMACGFGICQGCPTEKSDKSGYLLVCKDGPVFNSQEIVI